jgi:hypothetical protein
MSDVLFQLTPCARLLSFFEIAKYSKHKKNDLKKTWMVISVISCLLLICIF